MVNERKKILILFLFLLSFFFMTSGGRITSSDELSYFLETQSIVENGSLAIPDSIATNGCYGKDNRFYLGTGIGFTIIAIPFYLLGKLFLCFFSVSDLYTVLVLKSFFSLTNQFICSILGILFYLFCRQFDYSRKTSIFLTFSLLFSTNLFPYAKSAMREPLLTLCLVGIAYFSFLYRKSLKKKFLHGTGLFLFFLLMTKISYLIILPSLFLYLLLIHANAVSNLKSFGPINTLKVALLEKNFWIASSIIVFWLIITGIANAIYNNIIFGNIFSSGYTQGGDVFTNPLWVGLYGFLFSSGKSIFFYAPIIIAIFWSYRHFSRQYKLETILFVCIFTIMTLFHAKFYSWAGDGSWGSRYLIPTLPFFIIMVGAFIEASYNMRTRALKHITKFLFMLGIIIQIGGSSIYLGSYLRYLGEYPFIQRYTDPEFLYKSHYIPNYSPVVGHWILFYKSVQKHIEGEMSNFKIANTDNRIPLSQTEMNRIIYIIDYWFMYMYYAGFPIVWIILGFTILLCCVLYLGIITYKSFFIS